jgi:hypothetical protein
MNLRKKSTREEFERALAQCKPEDFDGHTEFHRLTPEQRLESLRQAATFVYEFKGKANPGVQNVFTETPYKFVKSVKTRLSAR